MVTIFEFPCLKRKNLSPTWKPPKWQTVRRMLTPHIVMLYYPLQTINLHHIYIYIYYSNILNSLNSKLVAAAGLWCLALYCHLPLYIERSN